MSAFELKVSKAVKELEEKLSAGAIDDAFCLVDDLQKWRQTVYPSLASVHQMNEREYLQDRLAGEAVLAALGELVDEIQSLSTATPVSVSRIMDVLNAYRDDIHSDNRAIEILLGDIQERVAAIDDAANQAEEHAMASACQKINEVSASLEAATNSASELEAVAADALRMRFLAADPEHGLAAKLDTLVQQLRQDQAAGDPSSLLLISDLATKLLLQALEIQTDVTQMAKQHASSEEAAGREAVREAILAVNFLIGRDNVLEGRALELQQEARQIDGRIGVASAALTSAVDEVVSVVRRLTILGDVFHGDVSDIYNMKLQELLEQLISLEKATGAAAAAQSVVHQAVSELEHLEDHVQSVVERVKANVAVDRPDVALTLLQSTAVGSTIYFMAGSRKFSRRPSSSANG
eukprot:GHVT01063563.1.p2 GENE.GHVT01063563.1~~GHVT01063563.1.p2  ORF type:complete len:408 (+),score=98.50 GHVT01063563.1:540-1763(+)